MYVSSFEFFVDVQSCSKRIESPYQEYWKGPLLNRWIVSVSKYSRVPAYAFKTSRVSDIEAIAMSRYIAKHDGLFLGSSSAVNLVACVQLAKRRKWHNKEKIVTILCDSGSRHFSKVRDIFRLSPSQWTYSLFSFGKRGCRRWLARLKNYRNDDYLSKANQPIDTSRVNDLLNS